MRSTTESIESDSGQPGRCFTFAIDEFIKNPHFHGAVEARLANNFVAMTRAMVVPQLQKLTILTGWEIYQLFERMNVRDRKSLEKKRIKKRHFLILFQCIFATLTMKTGFKN
jgi:hypothetical protein